MILKILASCWAATGWMLLTPLIGEAALLALTGRVTFSTSAPVENARLVITFYGHEMGIHEYTEQQRIQAQTNELGEFNAAVKVPDNRYIWTHATIEIAETDRSKAATAIARCEVDEQGGGRCHKEFRVNSLILP